MHIFFEKTFHTSKQGEGEKGIKNIDTRHKIYRLDILFTCGKEGGADMKVVGCLPSKANISSSMVALSVAAREEGELYVFQNCP